MSYPALDLRDVGAIHPDPVSEDVLIHIDAAPLEQHPVAS
jgi:hypothetical protein